MDLLMIFSNVKSLHARQDVMVWDEAGTGPIPNLIPFFLQASFLRKEGPFLYQIGKEFASSHGITL